VTNINSGENVENIIQKIYDKCGLDLLDTTGNTIALNLDNRFILKEIGDMTKGLSKLIGFNEDNLYYVFRREEAILKSYKPETDGYKMRKKLFEFYKILLINR